jgi:D-alanyl-D-alanine-carboxypeptidase/D-alanyl-D-alanine-endopeptidase
MPGSARSGSSRETDPLQRAVRDAAGRAGRRPGLLVVGATDGSETAVASAGPVPDEAEVAERAMFEIGSVTKVFTALLLAIAVQRGEVRLDDPLAMHLPPGSRVPRRDLGEITLVHLATHTSGLPRLPPHFFWEALRHRNDPYAELTSARVLAALAHTRPGAAAGERLRYSNFGAGLLGIAVGHVAATDYETLVRERIARPLGMNDTVISLDEEQWSRLAPGTKWGGKPAGPWTVSGLAGAGALRSTVADLLTFLRAQMGVLPSDVSAELADAIRATHGERARGGRLAPALRMGLGWFLLPIGPQKLATIWHNGGTGGYRSYVGWAPAIHAGIVVLSSNSRSVDRVGTQALVDLASSAGTGAG